ncbi:hypothetical protein L1887_20984 [Cichorium endivia]|nr:hypothetical protein L1887_20984 [Cichorium endivia]
MNMHVLFLGVILILGSIQSQAALVRYTFVVQETNYTRLCSTKSILTVNGQYPGPTISAHRGDTVIVNVVNQASQNITIHWHGVKLPRYPWSDGPEFITQCPIQPGSRFSQKIILSDEEGTLWWHAHSDWSRATVHGLLVISPKIGTTFPFPKPHAEVPVILGDWWKNDIQTVMEDFLRTGGDPAISDALTINGQPGDLYNCSRPAIRFRANNPGVWFMHCHFERHVSWGMEMVFIVRNGKTADTRILPPPPDMPKC